MYKFISDQIDEHERTFDDDSIRDFVDLYWRSVKHEDASERKYLTSSYTNLIVLNIIEQFTYRVKLM